MTAEEFWQNVARGPGCWPWKRGKDRRGYGRVRFHGRRELAHRVAWMLTFGPIPPRQNVLHSCDNPPCCRPTHFFLGTQKDNMADAARKGRTATGDRNGSRLHSDHVARGERQRSAKLTSDAVREIRRRAARGETQTSLGREFGINRYTIRSVVHRETWAHVP